MYVALQLAKLLLGDRDPPIEVIWEKKALDLRNEVSPPPLHVDDVVIRTRSGKVIYVQLKESAPSGGWSGGQFTRSGVARQFWDQWRAISAKEREGTILRLASGGDIAALNLLVDVALRSRTPQELTSDEASEEIAADAKLVAHALGLAEHDQDFLAFLKSIQAEQLPAVQDLEGVIIRNLAVFGDRATDIAHLLVRLVARSKHAGAEARSSYVRDSLISDLRKEGIPHQLFVAAGVLPAKAFDDPKIWDQYRARVVEKFRSFRVYGLQVQRAVYADLAALFVPLRLTRISHAQTERSHEEDRSRRSLTERILAEDDPEGQDERRGNRENEFDLASALREKRRLALVGGPGTGKTTTLNWLAIISALPASDGQEIRSKFGLGPDPLVPVHVRFRQFAERVHAKGLEGVGGRVGLVADFIAAEFEAGIAGETPVSRNDALRLAQDVLNSENTLLLFDGLDEVADEPMRNRLFEAVADLMQTYAAPRVVVSSRPYAFCKERSPIDLALFEPLPFDRASRRMFCRQWYRAVRFQLGPAIADKEAEAAAEDLSRAAERLADLAEIPLLLSILAMVHFNRQGLPVERATLYDHATLAMLGHWERDPSGRNLGEESLPENWATKLRLENEALVRRVTEWLAYRIQCHEGGGEFIAEIATNALAQGLASVAHSSRYSVEERADLLLRLLVERAGLLQERSPGTFAFAHLSFQEYLAARWLIGQGERGLEELRQRASDERQAEVIRLAVAIMTSDQRQEGDARAKALISDVARTNPILCAACLLEAPRLQIEPSTADNLAREVWSECTDMERRHYHPRVASRLVSTLLEQSSRPDHLLLEFLSDEGPEGRKRPHMEFEMAFALVAARPRRPLEPELAWVLRHLSTAHAERHPVPFRASSVLLLLENGGLVPEEHIPTLVELLGERHWEFVSRRGDTLGHRAGRILRDLLGKDETAQAVHAALETAVGASDRDVAWGAARFLISIGKVTSGSLVRALVSSGLYSQERHGEVCTLLKDLLGRPETQVATLAALKEGLADSDSDVRNGSRRVLEDAKMALPEGVAPLASGDEPESQDARLSELLTNPETRAHTTEVLAEDLWSDDEKTSWRAACLLLDVGLMEVPGLLHALVTVGLGSPAWRNQATQHLRNLRTHRLNLAVRATLFEGLRNASDRVATASATVLLGLEDEQIGFHLGRVVRAGLRDASQISDVLPHLQKLMNRESSRPTVIKSAGEYFGGKTIHREVASLVGRMLAAAGQFATPNLATALVEGALAKSVNHSEAIVYLSQMLEESRLVTDARKALGKGLSSDDANVAWGAARCLYERGSYTDPQLAAALVRVGLSDTARRDSAREWLLRLLLLPRIGRRTRNSLEQALYSALHRSNEYEKNRDLAWEIASCLIEGKAFHAEYLSDGIVRGGFGKRDRHIEVLAAIKHVFDADARLSDSIEDTLWDCLGESQEDVAWGAARALIETGRASPDLSAEDDDNAEKRLIRLLRIVLREAEREPTASDFLSKFTSRADVQEPRRVRLTKVLDDNDAAVAYTAARYLLTLQDFERRNLPAAIVRGGLSAPPLFRDAARALDEIRMRPSMAPAVSEALNRALWGENSDAAWGAAVYMIDRGELQNPGIPRALVFGGLSHYRHMSDAEKLLAKLLADPSCRSAAIDALGAGLLGEYHGERFHVATLLVKAGAPLNDLMLREIGEVSRWWPVGPLALLAAENRVREAREGAKRLGIASLAELLGDDPFPGDISFIGVSR